MCEVIVIDDDSLSGDGIKYKNELEKDEKNMAATLAPGNAHTTATTELWQQDNAVADVFFMCGTCQELLTSSEAYDVHIQQHKTETSLNQQTETYSCGYCNKTFSFLWQLRRHEKNHIDTGANNSYRLSCLQCSCKFATKQDLLAHAQQHDAVPVKQEVTMSQHLTDDLDTSKSRAVCKYCLKSFANKYILSQHIEKIHISVNHLFRHRCKACNIGFREFHELQMHEANGACEIDDSYSCEHCGIKFSRHFALRRHIETEHEARKRQKFQCTVCKVGFKHFDQLQYHTHAGNCGNKLISLPSYKKEENNDDMQQEQENINADDNESSRSSQLLTIASNADKDRKHGCKYCNKYFSDRYGLKRHTQNVHLSRRRKTIYQCPDCQVNFRESAHLKFHKQNNACSTAMMQNELPTTDTQNTVVEDASDDSSNQLLIVAKVATETNQYLCKYCQKVFPRQYSLTRHVENLHRKRKRVK